ncbi:MAG: putative SOS response-associated peptidase YedK, partial [Candidatus Omnitrophota bacterium]
MCGRFTLTNVNKSELSKRFNGVDVPSKLKAAYNIAPSQDIPVILNTSPKVISLVQWGLVSPWATDLKSAHRMNNARCETVTEKPSFKGPIKRSRCLVIADSFYEWQRKGARRQ